MSPRNIILIAVAVLIAAATALVVRGMTSSEPVVAEKAPVSQTKILVATSDISAGSFVKASQNLEWKEWPEESVAENHILEKNDNLNNYDGAVARRPIRSGEAIYANMLLKPGAGGFLSAVLDPGMRAISIAVSPTTGAAGFIFPGDRVDLIVTHNQNIRETNQSAEIESIVSETFVKNARVVAVDQMLDNPENKAILAKTVTVEVSPKDAEKISVAQELGKISFALRSVAVSGMETLVSEEENNESASMSDEAMGGPEIVDFVSELEGAPVRLSPQIHYTRDSDISQVRDRKGEAAPRIMVIRGDTTEQREFYQELD